MELFSQVSKITARVVPLPSRNCCNRSGNSWTPSSAHRNSCENHRDIGQSATSWAIPHLRVRKCYRAVIAELETRNGIQARFQKKTHCTSVVGRRYMSPVWCPIIRIPATIRTCVIRMVSRTFNPQYSLQLAPLHRHPSPKSPLKGDLYFTTDFWVDVPTVFMFHVQC